MQTDTQSCRNCGTMLPKEAKYCLSCSQKNTTGKIDFWEMVREFLSTVFNLDSKFIKTSFALFIPGKLTTEYFQGKHKSYAHPIRIFLILGIIHFALVKINVGDNFIIFGHVTKKDKNLLSNKEMITNLDTQKQDLSTNFKDTLVNDVIDSLQERLLTSLNRIRKDSFTLPTVTSSIKNKAGKKFRISKKDLYSLEVDSLIKKYEVEEGFLSQLHARKMIKIVKDGDSFGDFVMSNFIWATLMMMPLLALLLKLLYIRRNKYYVEHLIFSFHFHAFVFLILSILYLTNTYLPSFISKLIVFGLFVYLYFAMKQVYQQGYLKTFGKFLIINFSYIWILTFTLILTLILGVYIF